MRTLASPFLPEVVSFESSLAQKGFGVQQTLLYTLNDPFIIFFQCTFIDYLLCAYYLAPVHGAKNTVGSETDTRTGGMYSR